MPGFVGIFDNTKQFDLHNAVLQASQSMLHYDSHEIQDLYSKDPVSLALIGRSLPGVNSDTTTAENDDYKAWVNGRIFSVDSATECVIEAKNEAQLLLDFYKDERLYASLGKIDGVFSAVILDCKRRLIHLITDRYGLAYLYWMVGKEGFFAWSSELKSLLTFNTSPPEVNPESLKNFLTHGYMFNDETWFKGIELVSPASIYTWRMEDKTLIRNTYWSWSNIKLKQREEDEAVATMGELFQKAVRLRTASLEQTTISLSGGLDSRAILAALPKRDTPWIYAGTVGNPDSAEVLLAQMAARKRNDIVQHNIRPSSALNLVERIPAIWLCDGMTSIKHLHGAQPKKETVPCYISLNGFLGDVIAGGSYMNNPQFSEAALLNSRGRRFINVGLIYNSQTRMNIIPFMDNALVEYCLSLEPHLRQDSRVYKKMLLEYFPDYFNTIPWTSTGKPIGNASKDWTFYIDSHSEQAKFRQLLKNDPDAFRAKPYVDYATMLRQEPTRSFLLTLLQSRTMILCPYVDSTVIDALLKAHQAGSDYSELLCRYLTAELYLRQTINPVWRTVPGI